MYFLKRPLHGYTRSVHAVDSCSSCRVPVLAHLGHHRRRDGDGGCGDDGLHPLYPLLCTHNHGHYGGHL